MQADEQQDCLAPVAKQAEKSEVGQCVLQFLYIFKRNRLGKLRESQDAAWLEAYITLYAS
jgi:hypothetical protein